MDLKEAIDLAKARATRKCCDYPDAWKADAEVWKDGTWGRAFAAILEESGFVIVPKDATAEMARGMRAACVTDAGGFLDVSWGELFAGAIAARPRLEDR